MVVGREEGEGEGLDVLLEINVTLRVFFFSVTAFIFEEETDLNCLILFFQLITFLCSTITVQMLWYHLYFCL